MSKNLIDDMSFHLGVSKNQDYQKRVKKRFLVFCSFLSENKLLSEKSEINNVQNFENIQIYDTDLTCEGLAVVKGAYDKWLRALDKGVDVTDVSVLQKYLAKIRG